MRTRNLSDSLVRHWHLQGADGESIIHLGSDDEPVCLAARRSTKFDAARIAITLVLAGASLGVGDNVASVASAVVAVAVGFPVLSLGLRVLFAGYFAGASLHVATGLDWRIPWALTIVAAWCMPRYRGPVREIALRVWSRPQAGLMLFGLVFGLVVLAWFAPRTILERPDGIVFGNQFSFAGLLAGSAINAVAEETIWRGTVFAWPGLSGQGRFLVIHGAATGFGLAHWQGGLPNGLLGVLFASIAAYALILLTQVARSLWPAWAIHVVADISILSVVSSW